MPGNLAAAAPSTVMPAMLSTAFERSDAYHGYTNDYRDGRRQSSVLVGSSRASWRLAPKLSPAQASALLTFYLQVNGPYQPFYFYDPHEPAAGRNIGSNFDSGGVNPQGRYIVRFEGELRMSLSRTVPEAAISLVEIA